MKVVKVEDLEKMFDMLEETCEIHFSDADEDWCTLEKVVNDSLADKFPKIAKAFRTVAEKLPMYDVEIGENQ